MVIAGRSTEKLERLAHECVSLGAASAFPLTVDLGRKDECASLFPQALNLLGSVDVLINNAGFNTRRAPLNQVTVEEWDSQVAVNLRAPFILCRDALNHMLPRRSGSIINILSVACFEHVEGMSVYSMCKMGLMGLTRSLFYEAGPNNIRVTAIYPGATDSAKRFSYRIPYLQPETVAAQVVHVLSLPPEAVVPEIVLRPMLETAR